MRLPKKNKSANPGAFTHPKPCEKKSRYLNQQSRRCNGCQKARSDSDMQKNKIGAMHCEYIAPKYESFPTYHNGGLIAVII